MKVLFLLAISLCLSPSAALSTELTFSAVDSGRNQKVAARVLNHIYQKIGYSIVIQYAPAKRAEFLAMTGRTDGEIMRIWDYGVNKTELIRVPTPYYALKTMVFTRTDRNILISSIADLKNFHLAKIRGIKHTDAITKDIEGVYEFESTTQMMKFLLSGRADAALTSLNDGLLTLKKMNISNIKPNSRPLVIRYLYHYIHKKNAHLVPIIDQTFKDMQTSGELQRLFKEKGRELDHEALLSQ
ncbi:substrate-binding periplasmic protein [Marinomonas sp. 2405UD68-3]|uniref:substrate-binding periplasmic protein n=1 Tax=Marinomonas sp. 2405UD68-3 TaxID=3391835 RepID=UPI0039C8DD6A